MKRSLLFLLLFGGIALSLTAQTVRGTISDAVTGETLVGATVLEKGTNNGAVANLEGEYQIVLQSETKNLIVSYTGYASQTVQVDGRSTIDIALTTNAFIDEVVVVGYGAQKKSNVTGAISQIKEDDLEDMQVNRLEQALQGRASGVRITQFDGQPGAGSFVRIRGTSSINGADPLYVVDGVVIGGGIDYLNPNDIASIEVLKDAASAAIYGARSGNGVIIVTTKAGKAGKMRVNYSAFQGIQNPWKKLPVLNAREYGIIQNEMAAAAGQALPFESPDALGEGTDWQDLVFYKNAPISSHQISISGGTEKTKFYSSAAIFEQDGIVAKGKSNYRRLSARLNLESQVNERLKFGFRASYARNESRGITANSEFGSPLGRALNIDPITPLYETDAATLAEAPYTQNGALRPDLVQDENGIFAISPYVTSEIVNPVAANYIQNGMGWADKFVPTVYGEMKLYKGLKARSSFGGDLAFWGGSGFTPVYYLNATNVIDTNSVNESFNRGFTWIWDNTLTYDFNIQDEHQFSVMAGHSAQETNGRYIGGSKRDVPSSDPNDATIDYARNEDSEQIFGGKWERYAIESYFSRLNYNFRGKYLLTAIMRADASSKFGQNYRWGYFPSLSVGWNITDEDFFPTNDAVNYMKLRAGWGRNGNDAAGSLEFTSTVGGGRNYTFGTGDTQVNGTSPDKIPNPDLRWESMEQINIGVDMTLFRHFNMTFDYFIRNTNDMLASPVIPAYIGNSLATANIGDMQNSGIDLELGYSNKFNDFDFGLNGNVSYVKNEVVLIGNESGFISGQRWGPQGIEVSRITEGQPIGHLYGYVADGIFQNEAEVMAHVNNGGEPLQPDAQPGDMRFLDVNEDGIFDDMDRTIIGDPTPTWTYGFTLNAGYKGFDLVIFGQGVAGNSIFNGVRRYDLPNANMHADALGRWTGEGSTNTYPRLTNNDTNINFGRSSTFYVENGSFFRIKTAQLGYTIPESIAKHVGLARTRFYVSGTNLMTFTKYSGFDPELGGVDFGAYPQARTYTVGVNATFE